MEVWRGLCYTEELEIYFMNTKIKSKDFCVEMNLLEDSSSKSGLDEDYK